MQTVAGVQRDISYLANASTINSGAVLLDSVVSVLGSIVQSCVQDQAVRQAGG